MPFSLQTAFYLPKYSPFKAVLDHKLSELREAGIVDMFVRREMDKVAKRVKDKNVKVEQETLTLNSLTVAFILSAICLAIALSVFMCEILFSKK